MTQGPVATPDPSLWADPTRRRVLLALAERTDPVPLAELASEIGGHPNTTRAHLDALRASGLVDRTVADSTGRGRPSWLHGLTEVGRAAARRAAGGVGGGPLAHEHLAAAFIHYVAQQPDPERVAADVGHRWGASLRAPSRARTWPGRSRAVVDLLDQMGFTPVVVEQDRRTAEMVMHSCPLLEPAREHPEVVCAVHRGLVSGYLEQTGAGPDELDVQLDPWASEEGCRLRLTWGEARTGEEREA